MQSDLPNQIIDEKVLKEAHVRPDKSRKFIMERVALRRIQSIVSLYVARINGLNSISNEPIMLSNCCSGRRTVSHRDSTLDRPRFDREIRLIFWRQMHQRTVGSFRLINNLLGMHSLDDYVFPIYLRPPACTPHKRGHKIAFDPSLEKNLSSLYQNLNGNSSTVFL